MGELTQANDNRKPLGGLEVLKESAVQMPSAAAELAKEAWDHPWESSKHVLKTLATSAGAGLVLGALIPARGPVAAAVGIAFTMPLITGTVSKFKDYWRAGQRPGADAQVLGHAMARDFLSTGAELGLSTLGGFAGASAGMRLATSETVVGGALQTAQRAVLRGENAALVGLAKAPDLVAGKPVPTATSAEGALAADTASVGQPRLTQQPWFAGPNTRLGQRIAQFDAPPQDYTLRMGSLHGHSRYSDGMGTPKEIFTKAKQEGLDFYAITDHNHLAARGGIKDGDPRSVDQSGTPTVAEKPIYYSQTFADAAAVSQEGKFVALVGVEMGTIGKVGGGHTHGGGQRAALDRPTVDHQQLHQRDVAASGVEVPAHSAVGRGDAMHRPRTPAGAGADAAPPGSHREIPAGPGNAHTNESVLPNTLADGTPVPSGPNLTPVEQAIAELAAREAGHHSGVNHINLFEVPTFFEAIRQPRPQTLGESLWGPLRRLIGRSEPVVVKEPPVVKYNDGDYAALVRHLDQIKDSTGGRPVIQLNHPRYLADNNPDLPAKFRGRDYGAKSFNSAAEWREQFGKYASQIEVITGQALNPKPVEHLGDRDLGGVNLAGYVDKGLHVSPTYGRDDHFAMPGGRPAGTGIIADKLDKGTLLEAMRQRRTMATTDRNLLHGYTTANDRFVMGTILDQNAVQSITTTAHIGGDLAAGAQYKLTLWGDKRVGDGKLATALETREMTGAELSNLSGKVTFDPIHSVIGKKSAYWVEVQRVAPDGTFTDHMWTAPIWIEPIAGQHSLLTKALIGLGSQSLGL